MLPGGGSWWLRWRWRQQLPGADGLMIEVHDRPEEALSDGRQALTCGEFAPAGPTGAGTDGPAAAGGMTKGETALTALP